MNAVAEVTRVEAFDVVPIKRDAVPQNRDYLRGVLELALAHARYERQSADDLLDQAERGEALLLLVIRPRDLQVMGALGVELYRTPDSAELVAHVTTLAGVDMDEWLQDALDIGEALAEEQGCDAITLSGRPGWQKVLAPAGFRATAVVLAKTLGDDG